MIIKDDYSNIHLLRKKIFLTAYHSRTGKAHLASSFSIVEILYVLYVKKIMKYNVREPKWSDRICLFLAKVTLA